MEITDSLKVFGLTGQEATLYVKLLGEGSLTGYEAAKLTGISRSNTYTALAGLVDKGAAYVMEGKVTVYTPVPLDEFCDNRIRKLAALKEDILKRVPYVKHNVDGYITIKGEEEIINKLKNTINEAEERIYVSAPSKTIDSFKNELNKALKRGLKIVVITNQGFKLDKATIWYTEKENAQIRLIADSCKVITGDLTAGTESTCLYSCKENLVDLFKDALKNEIRLIELTGSLT